VSRRASVDARRHTTREIACPAPGCGAQAGEQCRWLTLGGERRSSPATHLARTRVGTP
jgi:hypothetical protein